MERRHWDMVFWVIALISINVIWSGLSDGEARHEINNYDHAVEDRTMSLEAFLGMDRAMPTRFEVSFKGIATDEGMVSWKIIDSSNQTVDSYTGMLSQEVPVWHGELAPDTYTIITETDSGIITEQTMFIEPLTPYSFEIHLALSLGTLLFALTDIKIRRMRKEKAPKPVEPTGKTLAEIPGLSTTQAGMPEEDNLDDSPWRDPQFG